MKDYNSILRYFLAANNSYAKKVNVTSFAKQHFAVPFLTVASIMFKSKLMYGMRINMIRYTIRWGGREMEEASKVTSK